MPVLPPGTRFGSYQVGDAIGSGGMGEVYRGTDTALKRDVAIKVLPESFARDADRLARFQREAEVLASLNHSNIAQIYGLEKTDGKTVILMELVEGPTLADRIARGPIPAKEALDIAMQIVAALEAAHTRQIVHRDLKPANVKVRDDGTVKVLDFGIAKALETRSLSGPQGPALTTPAMTQAGVVLGTAAYMAPEQARGKTVDARADIWAFGCVLYEMLTGQPAFGAEDTTTTHARVLERDADMSVLPVELSPAVRGTLELCLQKDPKKRIRDIGDVRLALEGAFASRFSAAPTGAGASRLASSLLAMAVLAIAALSIPAVMYLREEPAASSEVRLEVTPPATREPLHFALSPDGEHLVFVASGDGAQRLWLRPLASVTARPLASTEGAEYPFWSPDSSEVGFFAAGEMRRINIAGGPPQIVTAAASGRGGSWSRDGTILFAPTNASPLFVVPASGGERQAVTTLDPPRQGSHRFPQFLPDGRHFLFYAQGNPEGRGIYFGSLDDIGATRLTAAEANGMYAEPGVLAFMQQDALVVRRLDVTSGTLTGDLVTVADRVGFDSGFNLGGISVAAAGRLAYLGGASERRQLTWFDRDGNTLGVVGEPDANSLVAPMLSIDGRRISVVRTIQSNQDIWVIDDLRGGATRITSDPATENTAVWSPDAARLAFTSNRNGIYDLFVKPSSGAGAEELLLESLFPKLLTDWSLDGRFLLYQNGDAQNGWDLLALPMTGEPEPLIVASERFEERVGQFSPDGRWVAYQSDRSGRFEIYVQPFPGSGDQFQVSTGGGTHPRWRPDGEEIYFISLDGMLMAAAVRAAGSTFDAGSPTPLFRTRLAVGGLASVSPQYAVARDGRFLLNVSLDGPAPITVILNWNPGIEP
jgi:Tol biopolymer transport system component/predicted Ser/Thr protein kinase